MDLDSIGELRGLTVWQPWATLIAAGIKRYELRSWATTYRGWIAIHAGTTDVGGERFGNASAFHTLPRGQVVGFAYLDDICPIEYRGGIPWAGGQIPFDQWCFGRFEAGKFAWKLSRSAALDQPIRWTGAQGLWDGRELLSTLRRHGARPTAYRKDDP